MYLTQDGIIQEFLVNIRNLKELYIPQNNYTITQN